MSFRSILTFIYACDGCGKLETEQHSFHYGDEYLKPNTGWVYFHGVLLCYECSRTSLKLLTEQRASKL